MVFTPFYLPIVGLMSLFFLSYLSLMPTAYKLQVLTLVYFFTILLPTVLIHLYRKYQGWNLIELGGRTLHSDSMRADKRVVEDFYAYVGHRRCGRSTVCVW